MTYTWLGRLFRRTRQRKDIPDLRRCLYVPKTLPNRCQEKSKSGANRALMNRISRVAVLAEVIATLNSVYPLFICEMP